jgi:hypothetical protein
MTSESLINDPDHWRARAEEARIRLKTRCCGSRMTTSTLLSGSKIGPCGICHRTEIHNTFGGLHGHLYSAVNCVSDFRDWFCAESGNRLIEG